MTLSVDPVELKSHYESLDTEEIVSLLTRGGLEPEAESIARQELVTRGLSDEPIPAASSGDEADPVDGQQLARQLWKSGLVRTFLLGGAVWAMLMAKLVLRAIGIGIGFIWTVLAMGLGWIVAQAIAKSICASKAALHRDKRLTLWALLVGMCAVYVVAAFLVSNGQRP